MYGLGIVRDRPLASCIVLYDLSVVKDRPSVSFHYRLADVVSALRQDVSEKVSRCFSLSAFSSLFLPPYCALVILRIPARPVFVEIPLP